MSRPADLLVVGAGPAGAALATWAAAAGCRVTLIERARFPRDKVCGEFLSAEGCRVLERLGVLDELVGRGATWIERCRVSTRDGRSIELALPELPGHGRRALGVSRAALDWRLLQLAAEHGVEVRQRCSATAPIIEGRRVVGVLARRVGSDEAPERLRAALVVAADGRRSFLVRHLHPHLGDPLRSGPRSWFGLQVHLAPRPTGLGGRVELHLFRGGYVGLAGVDADRVNLCLLVRVAALRECGGSPQRLLAERILKQPAVRESIGEARPVGAWRSVGPLGFAARRPTAAGALLVGDAAGTIDPFSGEGMSNALCGAELALPTVLRAVERGGLTDELARRYAVEWRRAFAPVTRRVRWLGRLFERPRLAEPALQLLAGRARPLARRLLAATRTGRGLRAPLRP